MQNTLVLVNCSTVQVDLAKMAFQQILATALTDHVKLHELVNDRAFCVLSVCFFPPFYADVIPVQARERPAGA